MTCLVSIIQLLSYNHPVFSSQSFSNYLTIFHLSNSFRKKDLLHQPSPKSSKPPILPSFTISFPCSYFSHDITSYPQPSPLSRHLRIIFYYPTSLFTSSASSSHPQSSTTKQVSLLPLHHLLIRNHLLCILHLHLVVVVSVFTSSPSSSSSSSSSFCW